MHYNRAYRSGELVLLRPDRGVRIDNVYGEATREQRAYFAGYFDGEGCVTVGKAAKPRLTEPGFAHFPLHVEFKQTRPEIVLELRRLYGGTLRIEIPDNENWRPSVKWILARAETARKFLVDIQPFVREKKDQVDLVLRDYITPLRPRDGEQLRRALQEMKRRPLSIDEILAEFPHTTVHERRSKRGA